MASKGGKAGSTPAWSPYQPAVSIARDPHSGEVTSIGHATYPYEATWDALGDPTGLFRIASQYLRRVDVAPGAGGDRLLGLPDRWHADLADYPPGVAPLPGLPGRNLVLLWLPFRARRRRRALDPRRSFWVTRYRNPDAPAPRQVIDRTAVLLACLHDTPARGFAHMGGQGMRVVAHVEPKDHGASRVRITGMSVTLPRLSRARLMKFAGMRIDAAFVVDRIATFREATGVAPDARVSDVGVRIGTDRGQGIDFVARTARDFAASTYPDSRNHARSASMRDKA